MKDILFLEPVFLEKPWGMKTEIAQRFAGVEIPKEMKRVGEIWWVHAHHEHDRYVSDVVKAHGKKFLGAELERFLTEPMAVEKTEAWYVSRVSGGVDVIADFKKEIDRDRYEELMREGYFENPENLPVGKFVEKLKKEVFDVVGLKEGQTFIIKPGTVHAIIPRTDDSFAIISEIQQGYGGGKFPLLVKTLLVNGPLSIQVHPGGEDSASIEREFLEKISREPTIRISDFRGRETSPEKAAKVIKFGKRTFSETLPIEEIFEDYTITHLVVNRHFAKTLVKVRPEKTFGQNTGKKRFYIIRVREGSGRINEHEIERGAAMIVPAGRENYTVEASDNGIEFFLEYVPNLKETAAGLLARGFPEERIRALDGYCSDNDFDPLF